MMQISLETFRCPLPSLQTGFNPEKDPQPKEEKKNNGEILSVFHYNCFSQ